MDYASEDRLASSWVVTARRNGTTLYLSDGGIFTDRLSRAKVFRWLDQAEGEAVEQNNTPGCGFGWRAQSYPAAFSRAAG